ncbi:hypothetical protein U1Q18_008409 [Sarracenia purpurea var. burkii]
MASLSSISEELVEIDGQIADIFRVLCSSHAFWNSRNCHGIQLKTNISTRSYDFAIEDSVEDKYLHKIL